MKTIGMLGGMSWESSLEYYRIVNEVAKKLLGGLHSAKCLMYSVDFFEVEKLQHEGNWKEATRLMVDAAQRVERGGADFLIICTNTMHKMADDVQASLKIPLLHIADPTGQRVINQGIKRIGLLGTRFTMQESFYRGRLSEKFELDVLVPPQEQMDIIHRVIYEELCLGIINPTSKKEYLKIIDDLVKNGAQGIILGCTEIGLLVKPEDCPIFVFDTTLIHAEAAVDLALS